MIFFHTNYRSFLRGELVERLSKNPSYSLRAFAQKLGLAPSSLSEVLSGKKKLSRDAASRITRILRLNVKEAEYFCLLVEYELAKSDEYRTELANRLRRFNPEKKATHLTLDTFKVISDWYHYPILELSMIPDFKFTPQKIATSLGISVFEAETAIERLLRLKLLTEDPKAGYRKTHSDFLTESGLPNEGLRNFHSQMLNKAIQSLRNQSPSEKFIGSETFPFDEKMLKDAEELTEEYFKKMDQLAQHSKKPTHVYHLGVQFFRLTKGQLS